MAHSHCTGPGTGQGQGTGTGTGCSVHIVPRPGVGPGVGKYYARMFTCPRNSSISSTWICFCCFTRLIKQRNVVNS